MTSHGSPYARFRRALKVGNPMLIQAAAAELPRIQLADALGICLSYLDHEDPRFERAFVRWVGRVSMEHSPLSLTDLRALVEGLARLPNDRRAAALLADRCQATGLTDVAITLRRWMEDG